MDAVTALQDKVDILKVLEHYKVYLHPHGSVLRSCCPIHGGNNPTAFVVNLDNGFWFCHTGGCGGGDVYELVQRMENISFTESVRWVARFFNIDLSNLEIIERKSKTVKEMKAWIKVMKARTKHVDMTEYIPPEPMRNVKKFRDFKESTLEHFGLKYIESVKLLNREGKEYTLHNRLVFPVIENGVQIGISFRRIKGTDVPKWSHQPANFETRNFLYNYDAVKHEPRIVIVEGIPDVWAYHEINIPACATFGAHVTEEQYRLLMKTGAELIWSFDGDEAGQEVLTKATSMFKNKADQWYIEFAQDEDPANIPRNELKLKYESRIRI